MPITTLPGATDVTVIVQPGAQLQVATIGVTLGGGGQVTNNGGQIIGILGGIRDTGPIAITNAGSIIGDFGPAIELNGSGTSTINNTGTITGNTAEAIDFDTAAGSAVTLDNMSGGSINGDVTGSGPGSITIINSGNFNGPIDIDGTGVNSLTANNNINGMVFMAGAQNTVVNAASLNSGLVLHGSSSNTVTNNAGGTINRQFDVDGRGVETIVNAGTINTEMEIEGTGSLFNSGTINSSRTTAILFEGHPGPFTLTLAPGFVINGRVLGTGDDTFQLGGTGSGSFNVGNIGPLQQYQGFNTFNKVDASTWLLTGAGTQDWTITGGTLIGDTNSLNGDTITNNSALVFNQNITGTHAGTIKGTGAVTIRGGGTVVFTGDNTYTGGTTINGATLQIDNGGVSGSVVGNITLNAAITRTATLVFDRSDNYLFGGSISGVGTINQIGTGSTTLQGDSGAFGGTTTVNAGALAVDGTLGAPSSTLGVNNGGTLTGTGTVGGTVTVNAGGILSGTQGMTLTTGPLTLNSGSIIDAALGTPGTTVPLFNVNGALTLAGTLNVTDLGGFGAGVYRLMNYTGALTDNGVAIGTLPPGTNPADLSVQTATPQQINLVNTGGQILQFWDGPGPPNDGVVNGGSGTWNAVNPNWTNESGTVNGSWTTHFAIFEGTPGTVTVDNSAGAISANGMQFVVGGYIVTGGTLMLTESDSIIRVGDGTAAGAGYTATIDNVLAGAVTLEKTDAGTLVLNGANTYSEGTLIEAGTISISSDANLGGPTSGLTFADGALQTTANITTDRPVYIGQHASFVTTAGTSLVLNDLVFGPGGLSEDGAGTLVLTRNDAYLGGTHINSGTLQLGNGGTSGAVMGDIENNGTLAFDRSDNVTVNGVISGTGGVSQIGNGTTVLTGVSTYSGPTIVASGGLTVHGALTGTSTVSVGDGGAATLIVETGAEIDSGSGVLGNLAGTTGTAIVTNAGSIWANSGTVTIGNAGTGTLIVSDQARLTAAAVVIAAQPGSTGTLIVGAPPGEAPSLTAGLLFPPTVTFGAGNGTLVFNHSEVDYSFDSTLSGSGTIRMVGPGTTVFTADSSAFSGTTAVNAGALDIEGTLGGATSTLAVNSGGTLSGGGTIGGTVTVNSGGTLAGIAGQVLTTGPLTLNSGSAINVVLGTPELAGLFNVNGPLTLAGTLNVADLGGFGPGSYRLFNYTGALTDNGVAFGTLPPDTTPASLTLQTAVGQQVNLINSTGVMLQFWDGPNGHNDGVIEGGTGTWDVASQSWTNASGTVNAGWQGGFAIFDGTPGTVTVDSSAGIVSATGMQFAVDGYQLNGGTLTLTGADPTIRVGDGTEDGADFTATIDNVLAGTGDLVKTDLGTLVLNGANTYSGGTLIQAGTISTSSDANLGAASGGVSFGDGALETTANIATNRNVDILQSASFVTATGTSLVLNGTVSGPGSLSEDGAGTLILAQDNTYLGGTFVNSGTLQLGNGGAFGAAIGTVSNNSVLAFDRADTFIFDGPITGAGNVTLIGPGTIVLTANSPYTGATTIGSGNLVVSGALTGTSTVSVGDGGVATLTVQTGGVIDSGNGVLGNLAGTTGTAMVTDANSIWVNTGTLTIGNAGTGTLILSDGSSVTAAAGVIAAQPGSTGTLIVGTPPGQAPDLTPGMLDSPTVTFGAGNGTLVFNLSNPAFVVDSALIGSGTIEMIGTGTTVFTADSSAFSGTTAVNAGTLEVSGTLGGPTSTLAVNSGGTLTGTGTVGGAVAVNSGGALSGSQGTTLTTGPLTLNSGSIINAALGTPGTTVPLFNVNGALTLAGTLNVTDLGGFDAGVYRLINYTGALTDNGVAFGTLPPGATPASLTVQTAVPQQVNLINSAASPLQFWDGPSGPNNGVIDGGTGTWDAVNQNWTNADGTVNTGWQSNFAIFEGTPGTVTVDNSAGAISTTGMQFAVDGYAITGGTLTLAGTAPVIRVGDGTTAGAGYTATIDNVLAGTGTLMKTDLGTLVLGGANTYSGGTTIEGGTISISSDANLGAASGGLSFAAGTLETTANIVTSRAVNVLQSATFETDPNTTLELDGAISGAGVLTKSGSGALLLTGAANQTGGTIIASGTLQLGNGGTSGSLAGNVTNNGSLIVNRSDAVTFAGNIIGTGSFTQAGSGTTILTGTSDYAGGTTIAAGTLQIGNGGTSGTITGNIVDNGVFAIDRSDSFTFTGTVSGPGSVVQLGTGTITVTGGNTFTGGLTIGAGTLVIGDGNTSGAYTGDIVDNATLAFDRQDVLTYVGAISGNGVIQQTGAGTTILSGTSGGFSGSTAINAGTLVVNGRLGNAASTLAVNNGGTLAGTGTIGGSATINAGGTLSPAGQTLGTLTVNGNLAFASGSIYRVDLTPAATDLVVVGGQARPAGEVQVVIAPGDYLPNTVYPIISAAGGVNGTFDTLDPPSVFFQPMLRYDANDVYLVLTDATFMSVAQTPNQLAVANAIATLPPTSPVFEAAFNLSSDAEARQAFDVLSGEAYASTAGAMLEESRYVRDAVLARLRGAYDVQGDVQGTLHTDAVDPPTGGAWFQGLGAFGSADTDGNAADWTSTVYGAIAGYDIAALEDWRVGAAGAYLHSALDVDARASHVAFDSFDLALYGAGQIDEITLRAGAAYAWQNVTMRRTVVFPGFSDSDGAHYRAPSVQGFGEVGYEVVLAPLLLEPFGNAAYVNVDTHGFSESGGGAALVAPDQSLHTTFATVGLHASSALGLVEGVPMSAIGTLGWQHAFDDVTPTETLAFAAGGIPFTIAGVPLARNTAVVEGGVNFAVTDAATVSLAYSGRIAGSVRDHEARAGFDWNF